MDTTAVRSARIREIAVRSSYRSTVLPLAPSDVSTVKRVHAQFTTERSSSSKPKRKIEPERTCRGVEKRKNVNALLRRVEQRVKKNRSGRKSWRVRETTLPSCTRETPARAPAQIDRDSGARLLSRPSLIYAFITVNNATFSLASQPRPLAAGKCLIGELCGSRVSLFHPPCSRRGARVTRRPQTDFCLFGSHPAVRLARS